MLNDSLQEKDFKNYVLGNDLLGDSVRWISKNLDPEDVFSDDALNTWASRNLDPEDVFEKSDVIKLASEHCSDPEEIFDTATLEAWALDNGWVHFG